MRPKKRYGQNFLINETIVNKIITSENLENKVVFEIGPGRGVLTQKLARQAEQVFAFEIDYTLSLYLDPIKDKNANLEIIYGDVLEVDFKKFIANNNLNNVICIANIPYYITGLLLKKLKETKEISTLILMLQKEVAERLTAEPGKRIYGSLSVMFNFYYDIIKVVDVKRTNFYPVPKVDSVVVKMVRKDDYLKKVNDLNFFQEFVEAAFKQKRKTLVNNLRAHFNLSSKEILNRLAKMEPSFNPLERAENISIKRFISFSNGWNND
ncbi:MAG: ribosomal RNA small subunit methyltransferase A [Acholeplasmataceae bacterium]|jgi:16S rRNA (adenine1518-N6/adenine1519-N6)-dimethyltransferase|nr:ribosomal RNA small subunit methyltransferase A [Acholeplasmataceae bacterium]